jgi:hypothetical protein
MSKKDWIVQAIIDANPSITRHQAVLLYHAMMKDVLEDSSVIRGLAKLKLHVVN